MNLLRFCQKRGKLKCPTLLKIDIPSLQSFIRDYSGEELDRQVTTFAIEACKFLLDGLQEVDGDSSLLFHIG